MKLKYYLRGLGIGILVTTILLMIAFARHKNDISDDEIIARAKELGMVMQEETENDVYPDNTEDSSETKDTPDSNKNQDTPVESETQEGVSRDSEAQDGEVQDSGAQENDSSADAQGNDGGGELIEFSVNPGESSNDIANALYEKGLVDDAAAFNEYLVSGGYDSFLLVRTVEIPMGASYEEVARILTEKKE